MPKAVFWNLGGAIEGPRWIEAILRTERPDLVAFSEIRQAVRTVPTDYRIVPCAARLHVLRHRGYRARLVDDGRLEGYAILRTSSGFVVAFCHLMSSVNGGALVRRDEMRELSSRLRNAATPWERVLVAGDLNCDPYDPDLVSYQGLHAKQTRAEALLPHRVRDQTYPKLVALGHGLLGRRLDAGGREFAGSFYYAKASSDELPWRLLDHALVSPDLVGATASILDRVEDRDLVPHLGTSQKRRLHPDHLPLVVEW